MSEETNVAYDAIDRFLRNNMDDDAYAEYSGHLETVLSAPPAQETAVAVGLEQFREAVEHWRKHHAGCASAPALLGNEACAEHAAKSAAAGRLLALIDSRSNSGSIKE